MGVCYFIRAAVSSSPVQRLKVYFLLIGISVQRFMNTLVRPDYVDAYLTIPSGMKSVKQTAVPLVAI